MVIVVGVKLSVKCERLGEDKDKWMNRSNVF